MIKGSVLFGRILVPDIAEASRTRSRKEKDKDVLYERKVRYRLFEMIRTNQIQTKSTTASVLNPSCELFQLTSND
jgi:hypothetical protein